MALEAVFCHEFRRSHEGSKHRERSAATRHYRRRSTRSATRSSRCRCSTTANVPSRERPTEAATPADAPEGPPAAPADPEPPEADPNAPPSLAERLEHVGSEYTETVGHVLLHCRALRIQRSLHISAHIKSTMDRLGDDFDSAETDTGEPYHSDESILQMLLSDPLAQADVQLFISSTTKKLRPDLVPSWLSDNPPTSSGRRDRRTRV